MTINNPVSDTFADPWVTCRAYLEAHCNPSPYPFPESTVRYARVLWMLADCMQVTSVLEVGIGPTAVSGSIWCHSMGLRGGGRLYSIDIDTRLPRPQDRALAEAQHVVWTVIHGDSLEVADQLPAGLQVDLLYIDGDHDLPHAYGDTRLYLPCLKPGGYLVIDDYPGFEGVECAIRQFEAEGFQFVHLSHNSPHGNGRAVWQKPLRAA